MKLTQLENRVVGRYEVPSGSLIVSDPCYERGCQCAAEIPMVKDGVWVGSVGMAALPGGVLYVTELITQVIDCPDDLPWIDSGITVGVDSGQMGIFDRVEFDKRPRGKLINVALLSPFGIVSSTGFGDGVYSCLVKQHAGKTVAVKVVFLSLNDLDDLRDLEGGAS
jgi:hypothetical protein